MTNDCSFTLADGETKCGHKVVVDLYDDDAITGSRLIVMLCQSHATNGRLANAVALGMYYNYRESAEPHLKVVES